MNDLCKHPALCVTSMKVNQTVEPVGIDTTPVFSWIPASTADHRSQSAYRLVVASTPARAERGEGDLFDSGRVESAAFTDIPYRGSALTSHTAYYWRVTVWDNAGDSADSSVSRLVTGVLSMDEWTGDWIGLRHEGFASTYLRKSIAISGEVADAYLSLSGLGYFDLQINGRSPDDSLMNCCNTQYTMTVPYRTFDVAAMLREGENTIDVELGNGFYNEQGGVWNWQSAEWRDTPKMRMQFTIRYTDGRSETVVSDDSWLATVDGPTTYNSIYYGECIDARKTLEKAAWQKAEILQAPKGVLRGQVNEPMRRIASFAPAEIQKREDGSYVVTAPEMITGWAKILFKNQPIGRKITILYGEKILPDGNLQKLGGPDGDNAHWWPGRYIMTDEYITGGEETEVYEPKFCYKGYCAMQIWGYEGELTAEDITLYRVANSLDTTGCFATSHELINDLHAMMVRTMQNNTQGKPTDTPVWEKNGWLGDLNVALECFTHNFGCSAFLPAFISTMEDCFNQYGILPNMVPTAGWGVAEHYVWNTVMVFAVYEMYRTYGMKQYMTEQYPVLKRYARSILSQMEQRGWIASHGQLGDWVSPMNGKDLRYNESPNEGSGIVATSYVYKMLSVMAKMASLTENSADVLLFANGAEKIYTAFNEKFYNADEGCYDTTVWYPHGRERTKFRQTSQLVPLAVGLVPEALIPTVVERLVTDIREKNCHPDTGCVGAREILPILTQYGYADLAYTILTQITYPSWGFMIAKGATSLWEMWETTTRSRAHYFLGTYDRWLYEGLAGICDIEAGYERFTIAPYIPRDLDSVTCTRQTVRGEVESSWHKNSDGTLTMKITVPFGATATVIFPVDASEKASITKGDCKIEAHGNRVAAILDSGSYTFTVA